MTQTLCFIPDTSLEQKFVNKRIHKSSKIAVNDVLTEYHSV